MSSTPPGSVRPCSHGVIDDICNRCTAHNLWRMICERAPSKHLQRERAKRAFGYRAFLAEAAMQEQSLRYLEIGVRLGHSLALVVLAAEVLCDCKLEKAVGIDAWIPNYGGEDNPGAVAVYELLEDLGANCQNVELITGDSHVELLKLRDRGYLIGVGRVEPRPTFHLILVDGDHTPAGAKQDLRDAFAMLEPGGKLVFDDARARGDDTLLEVWRAIVADWHGDGVMIDAHEVLDDEPGWCWLRRAPLA